MREAIDHGADAIALDVMRCGSGELVVCHEHVIGKLGDRHWDDVAKTPLAALRELDLGGGERIPLLADAFAAIGRSSETSVLVELRLRPAPGDADRQRADLAAAAAATVARVRTGDSVLFGSTDVQALAAFAPNVPTALLVHGLPRWTARAPANPPRVVELELPHADRAAVRYWHARGAAVHIWPATTTSQLVLAWTLQVDGVITSEPAAARATIDRLMRVAG